MKKIRQATPSDLSDILAIERESFADPWSLEMFQAELAHPFSFLWIVEEEGEVLAFVCFWFIEDEIHLLDLAVAYRHRRGRIASLVIQHLMTWSQGQGGRKIFLEVREGNDAGRQLYQRMGFKVIQRRAGYYQKPREDALVMLFEGLRCEAVDAAAFSRSLKAG
jgi:ribosomal-protein-alanine N-acetyltransferase